MVALSHREVADKTIRLWDAGSGAHKHTLTGHTDGVDTVAFSPDGHTLASGSKDGTIRLWDVGSGAPKRTLTGHTADVESVAFSPDGRTIALGSADKTIRLWDAGSGAPKRTLTGHTSWVKSVAFSPDSRTLASGSWDGTVLLWRLTSSPTPNATVSISPSSVPSPAIGEQLTLSLKIADGEDVAGYQGTVQFNTSALRYVESANGDYLKPGAFFIPPVLKENRVVLASTAIDGLGTGDGTLATITFEVVAIKASVVTLSQVTLVNPAGERSSPQIKNGEVTEPPQIFGDVNGDGVVNIQDLVLVGANFGKIGVNSTDVNGDGVVDIVDLVKVAGAFGNTATAPALQTQALTPLTAADVQAWLTQARGLDLTDATMQRGIIVLEHLLAVLTPKETVLLPNYPNPFNPETWIPYRLAHPADVQITIYDTRGTVVRQLELGHQPAGFYTARAQGGVLGWPQHNLGNGSQVGCISTNSVRGIILRVRRMVIVK